MTLQEYRKYARKEDSAETKPANSVKLDIEQLPKLRKIFLLSVEFCYGSPSKLKPKKLKAIGRNILGKHLNCIKYQNCQTLQDSTYLEVKFASIQIKTVVL